MPLGFERINERKQRPNALINFVRPLPGPSSAVSEKILNRVAAICYPFMKSNMILVQALEEFPHNNEFVGRNFNAGEVIQLVLRDRNGRWLSDKMIQMVMVHELAHCKQMNHSKAFWKVRDQYAGDLRALWARGYTGEGLWGRGTDLGTGVVQMREDEVADVPEHLCGGTYGRRSKKRKKGGKGGKEQPTLSYAEKKQRRILKKFGAGGQALGADQDTKVKLEGGEMKKGKPRVARSARGRDLRAAAALARFDNAKKEDDMIKKEEISSDSETEDEFEEGDQTGAAVDVDGSKMLDEKGRALVKICDDEDDKDEHAMRELEEIQGFARQSKPSNRKPGKSTDSALSKSDQEHVKRSRAVSNSNTKKSVSTTKPSSASVIHLDEQWKRRPDPVSHAKPGRTLPLHSAQPVSCPVCSFQNDSGSLSCAACLNCLRPELMPDHWKCSSSVCKDSKYINIGDAGVCGVCGASKGS